MTKLNFFLIYFFLMASSVLANEENTVFRNVQIKFKEEIGYNLYQIEIIDHQDKATQYEIATNVWLGSLPVGDYKYRARVLFKDETYSDWSELFPLNVSPFQLIIGNQDQIYFFSQDNQIEISWVKINRADRYEFEWSESELLNYSFVINDKSLEKKDLKSVKQKTKENLIRISDVRNSRSKIKIKAFDKNNLEIANKEFAILIINQNEFSPKFDKTKNNFIRNLTWTTDLTFKKTSIKIFRKSENGKWVSMLNQKNISENNCEIPLDWPGGEYKAELFTHLSDSVLTKAEIIQFELKEGNRDYQSEIDYFKNALLETDRQYYRYFNVIVSNMNFTSIDVDNSAEIFSQGQVVNLSYGKSEPIKDSILNSHLKISSSIVNFSSNQTLLFDANYGLNFNYFGLYPFFFKSYLLLGFEKNARLASKSSDNALIVEDTYFFKTQVTQGLYYSISELNSIGLDVSLSAPVLSFDRSDSKLSKGFSYDYGIQYSTTIFQSKDRLLFGFKVRNESYEFTSRQGTVPNQMKSYGTFLNIGYIMETNL